MTIYTIYTGGSESDPLMYVNVPIMDLDDCNVCMDGEVEVHEVCAGVCGPNPGDSCQVRFKWFK